MIIHNKVSTSYEKPMESPSNEITVFMNKKRKERHDRSSE